MMDRIWPVGQRQVGLPSCTFFSAPFFFACSFYFQVASRSIRIGLPGPTLSTSAIRALPPPPPLPSVLSRRRRSAVPHPAPTANHEQDEQGGKWCRRE